MLIFSLPGDPLHLELARVRDLDRLRRLAAAAPDLLDGLDDVHALEDAAEDDVAPVEPGRLHRADEDLRAVRAGARVRHGEHAGARVLELEVLVGELLSINRLAARAVAPREVASLEHEVRDHAVELRALVVEGLAGFTDTLL